jgi:hypothetical protein
LKYAPTFAPRTPDVSSGWLKYAGKFTFNVDLSNGKYLIVKNKKGSNWYYRIDYETDSFVSKTITKTTIIEPVATKARPIVSVAQCPIVIDSPSPKFRDPIQAPAQPVPQEYISGLSAKFFGSNTDYENQIEGSGLITGGYTDSISLTSTSLFTNAITKAEGITQTIVRSAVHNTKKIGWYFYKDNNGAFAYVALGYFTPPTDGSYTFTLGADDGAGLWIGDNALSSATRTPSNALINNNLGGTQATKYKSGTTTLTGGVSYPIIIMSYNDSPSNHTSVGPGSTYLKWSGPGIAQTDDLSVYFKTAINTNGTLVGDFV